MAVDTEAALAAVGDYAAKQEQAGAADHLKRYAQTSAEFAALGGTVGSVFPGVGTAIGALVGSGAGVVWEAAGDIAKWLDSDDGPKHVKERPDDAERAHYAYQALGGEKALGEYGQWWRLYVQAGRPPIEVLKAAQLAEREAKKAAKGKAPPPPAPPPPKATRAEQSGVKPQVATLSATQGATPSLSGDSVREAQSAAVGVWGLVLAGALGFWLLRR